MSPPRDGPPFRATYRVQLHAGFTFADAAAVVPYLAELGISHLYTSPILQAAAGSTHGYDVVDPTAISAELGGPEGFAALVETLHRHGMGLVLDIVPNHMATAGRANGWWWDVLENGPSSLHARAFDIDWAAADRILVPILGDQFGRVLEDGQLTVERHGGSFAVRYFDHEVPLSPRTLDSLLLTAAEAIDSDELASVATAFGHLPHALDTDPAAVAERHRDKELLRERLAARLDADPDLATAVDGAVTALNRDPDALDALLLRQNYRLASWRTAHEELDYRRFFNIETLVGVRVEDEAVLADSHALVADLVRSGAVDELRVDHIDGLRDPEEYLDRLSRLTGGVPVVVEKIVEGAEELPDSWPAAGMTGYEQARVIDGVFVDPAGEAAITGAYTRLVEDQRDFAAISIAAKQDIMRTELRAEIERVTALLATVCQRHRRHRDHTRHDLREALRAVLAAFPVYRTYVRPGRPTTAVDREHIAVAIHAAAAQHADVDAELLRFLGSVLAGDEPGPDEQELAVRFQQVSAPVMAKGVEDTAFYRYQRLVSLNEVGGDPGRFGLSVDALHRANARAATRHPRRMTTLSTHDTKRSSDVRARLHLLSEIPDAWAAVAARWHVRARVHRSDAGPEPATEQLLLQTMIGAWPLGPERLTAFAEKAAKEAKLLTSWTDPDPDYDAALRRYVEGVLGDVELRGDLEQFVAGHRLVERGRVNALAQTALLLTSPGVPDLYQGTEVWRASLVDPDNRRPVDYERRSRLLRAVGSVEAACAAADDGGPKLWLIHQVLADRRARPDVYTSSTYESLAAEGPKAGHVVAFARGPLVTVVPRLLVGLGEDWSTTTLRLPPGQWVDVVTGTAYGGDAAVPVVELLARFPVAVLASR